MSNPTVYDLAMTSRPESRSATITRVDGAVPPELRGTLLRNGPGVFEVGADTLNFFDAHALVAGLCFDDGAVRLRATIVDSALWKEERAAGRMTRRRPFTNLPGTFANAFKLELGNNVAHDVYAYGGKVVVSNDPGHVALDPATLATVGEERWNASAPRGTLMSPMPRVDPVSGNLVVYVQQQKPGKIDKVRFVELDPSYREVRRTEDVTLGAGPVLLHGHAFSGRWYVVTEMPARLSLLPALFGTKTIYDSFQWPATETPTVVLVARDCTSRSVRVATPGTVAIIFHCLNAYDDGDKLVLDCVSYERALPFSAIAPEARRKALGFTAPTEASMPKLVRYVIDPERAKVVESRELGTVPTEALDMDRRFRGKRHRYLYGPTPEAVGDETVGAFFGQFHGVVRVDTETGAVDRWNAGPRRLCSPPAFAARPGSAEEGDGWLLTWVIDGDSGQTDVVIHDARKVSDGPVATVHLDVALPGVSHSNFHADVTLSV